MARTCHSSPLPRSPNSSSLCSNAQVAIQFIQNGELTIFRHPYHSHSHSELFQPLLGPFRSFENIYWLAHSLTRPSAAGSSSTNFCKCLAASPRARNYLCGAASRQPSHHGRQRRHRFRYPQHRQLLPPTKRISGSAIALLRMILMHYI